jgi:hypothetical protein
MSLPFYRRIRRLHRTIKSWLTLWPGVDPELVEQLDGSLGAVLEDATELAEAAHPHAEGVAQHAALDAHEAKFLGLERRLARP